jgi:hypothetical protein
MGTPGVRRFGEQLPSNCLFFHRRQRATDSSRNIGNATGSRTCHLGHSGSPANERSGGRHLPYVPADALEPLPESFRQLPIGCSSGLCGDPASHSERVDLRLDVGQASQAASGSADLAGDLLSCRAELQRLENRRRLRQPCHEAAEVLGAADSAEAEVRNAFAGELGDADGFLTAPVSGREALVQWRLIARRHPLSI